MLISSTPSTSLIEIKGWVLFSKNANSDSGRGRITTNLISFHGIDEITGIFNTPCTAILTFSKEKPNKMR